MDNINSFKKANITKDTKEYQKILNSRIISNKIYLLDVWSRFMDIYTIGRMLKPGYNYCVVHGGAFHTVDIVKTLEKHGLISSKDPSFFELMDNQALIDYNELEKIVDL